MAERGVAGAVPVALPVLALLANALAWGVSWWPFRALQQHGLHPLWATALIYTVSLGCLFLVRPSAWKKVLTQPWLWLLVASAGITNVGFNWAVTVGDVVRVVLLFYLMPAWSVLLAWPLLGEKPTLTAVARLLLALAGVAVVLKTGEGQWPVPESLADWLALLGGAAFALTNILLRKLHDVPAESRIWAMFAGGALMASAAAAVGMQQGLVTAPPAFAPSWMGIALLLSAGFLVGNIALQYGASRLPAHTTALVMLSEVLFASVSSVMAGTAELTGRTLAGGVLIVLAAGWSAWPGPAQQGKSAK